MKFILALLLFSSMALADRVGTDYSKFEVEDRHDSYEISTHIYRFSEGELEVRIDGNDLSIIGRRDGKMIPGKEKKGDVSKLERVLHLEDEVDPDTLDVQFLKDHLIKIKVKKI